MSMGWAGAAGGDGGPTGRSGAGRDGGTELPGIKQVPAQLGAVQGDGTSEGTRGMDLWEVGSGHLGLGRDCPELMGGGAGISLGEWILKDSGLPLGSLGAHPQSPGHLSPWVPVGSPPGLGPKAWPAPWGWGRLEASDKGDSRGGCSGRAATGVGHACIPGVPGEASL